MEDVMDFPVIGEVDFVCYVGDFGSYPEGSVPPW
jgi:hypothetical protein